jgi:hypothetical protein
MFQNPFLKMLFYRGWTVRSVLSTYPGHAKETFNNRPKISFQNCLPKSCGIHNFDDCIIFSLLFDATYKREYKRTKMITSCELSSRISPVKPIICHIKFLKIIQEKEAISVLFQ